MCSLDDLGFCWLTMTEKLYKLGFHLKDIYRASIHKSESRSNVVRYRYLSLPKLLPGNCKSLGVPVDSDVLHEALPTTVQP